MNQDIFTFAIVLSAVAYALWSFFRALKPRQTAACGGCTGCAIKNDLKVGQTSKNYTNGTGKHLSQL